ncbi:hypothetical protein ANO14919_053640 [Xylariales sp. No.14919]|nr:hypothetical protein ANO14919_053640 [Xylariales sp. No.14919]
MKVVATVAVLFATGVLSAPTPAPSDVQDVNPLNVSPYKNFVHAADPHKVLGEK